MNRGGRHRRPASSTDSTTPCDHLLCCALWGSGGLTIGLSPRIGLKEVENRCVGGDLAAKWAGIDGKGASDGGSVVIDFRDCALYPSYTRVFNIDIETCERCKGQV